MGRFELLHTRLKTLGYESHSYLLFLDLDKAKNGKVILNESDLADLEHLIESLVLDLERTR